MKYMTLVVEYEDDAIPDVGLGTKFDRCKVVTMAIDNKVEEVDKLEIEIKQLRKELTKPATSHDHEISRYVYSRIDNINDPMSLKHSLESIGEFFEGLDRVIDNHQNYI